MDNELDSVQINNGLRPFFRNVTEHEPTMATIVLLTETEPNGKENLSTSIDYMDSFSSFVNVPSPDLGDQILPLTTNYIAELPKMTIPGITQYYGLFNNFSLTSVNESKEQMTKVHMNFGGSWNAFFFGDKPIVYAFSGFFLDSQEFPYYQEFMVAYDNYLCGRKCIENKFQMLLSYDGKIVDGYILGINTTINSMNPYMKAFSFTVLVKNENWYRTNMVRDVNGNLVSGLNYMSSERARIAQLQFNSMVPVNKNAPSLLNPARRKDGLVTVQDTGIRRS